MAPCRMPSLSTTSKPLSPKKTMAAFKAVRLFPSTRLLRCPRPCPGARVACCELGSGLPPDPPGDSARGFRRGDQAGYHDVDPNARRQLEGEASGHDHEPGLGRAVITPFLRPRIPVDAPMLTMDPPPCRNMIRAADMEHRKAPRTLVALTASQCASVISIKGAITVDAGVVDRDIGATSAWQLSARPPSARGVVASSSADEALLR